MDNFMDGITITRVYVTLHSTVFKACAKPWSFEPKSLTLHYSNNQRLIVPMNMFNPELYKIN